MTKLFSELGLSSELLKAIDKLGFEQAAPIQAEAIPVLLQGKDVVGQSQTGSGKTLAFVAPALDKVMVEERTTQVLILCPTRELAVQVAEEVHKLAMFKRGLHALPVYGGQSYDRQFIGLRQGAHVVIGTPGRIMDHLRRGTLRLNALKMVVLDEVDVMFNMGFRDDIELILQGTPQERQTAFFSATISRPIQQLIEKYSREPQNVRIESKALTVPTVEQVYFEVDRRFKVDLLTRLIDLHDLKLGIIFCNTRRMVDDLVEHLNAQGYSADRLHGEMTQAMRDRVMTRFRKSGLEFLVATDVAARGIDVENIEVVFNYDLPYDGEDYVHRIGRTGRQGRSGRAISFASGREVFQIRNIERYTNTRIQRGHPPTLVEVEEARANAALDKIRATLKSGEYRRQDHLIARLMEESFSSTDIASALLHLLQAGDGAPAGKAAREAPPRPGTTPGSRRPYGRPLDRRDEPRPARRRDQGASREHLAAEPPPKDQFTAASDVLSMAKRRWKVESLDPAHTGAGASKPPQAAPSRFPKRAAHGRSNPPRRAQPAQPAQARLFMNLGAEMGISERDIIEAIQGATGLPRETIGKVDLRERHLFVNVSSEQVQSIVGKLNRCEIKGRKAKVKVA